LARQAPVVAPFGDAALLVGFEQRIDPYVNACVHGLAAAVRRAAAGGASWSTPVPAYASLLVPYDPLRLAADEAVARLAELVAGLDWPDPAAPLEIGPPIEIAVHYGGDEGPDLDEVADRAGLTAAQVVELHCSVVYRAYMLGFAPGFAYLGELPAQLELPRRATPRPRVAAGSVAIAARQTAVYPQATPGGWHLLGRTDAPIWDPARPAPALISAGASVRFVPRA